jgi:hypothetical protein
LTGVAEYYIIKGINEGGENMGYEVFYRKIRRSGEPAVTFSAKGRMSFNKRGTEEFERNGVEAVLLLWDRDKRLLGVKPTKKDPRAYQLHYGIKGNGAGFSASTFFKYIGYVEGNTQSLPARWDEKDEMFVIQVPENYLKGK